MSTKVDNATAEDIADDLLFRTGVALVNGDLSSVADCFLLPQTLETVEGVRLIRTKQDICRVFEEVWRYYRDNGVTDVVRTIVEAKFTSDVTIESVHASRLMRPGGEVFRAPYTVFSLLKLCDDGAWRIAHNNYAIPDSRRHSEALISWRSDDQT